MNMITQAEQTRALARRETGGPDRRGIRRGVSLLPSLFTLANLFCGWACVVHAMRGEFATAAPFIGVAIVLDMLDGRIARMTGTTSDFGVQLDSLADLISFGMAPAVLVFQWGLVPLGRLGWAIGFLYLSAAALAPGTLQHSGGHRQALFRRPAESGRRRHSRRHGVLFPGRARHVSVGAVGHDHAAGAGAPDGQHHPLPEFQDARSRHQARLPRPGGGRRASSRSSSPIRTRR